MDVYAAGLAAERATAADHADLDEHRRLAAAIASGDPERARSCALGHVRANRVVTLDLLFGDPEETDTVQQ